MFEFKLVMTDLLFNSMVKLTSRFVFSFASEMGRHACLKSCPCPFISGPIFFNPDQYLVFRLGFVRFQYLTGTYST